MLLSSLLVNRSTYLVMKCVNATGLVDTEALMKGLRSGIISMAGLDVYENEAGYFFRDCSHAPVQVRLERQAPRHVK